MNGTDFMPYIVDALRLFLLISAPPLAGAIAIGLVVGILQAATQIQDQTLPQAFKLMVVIGVLVIVLPLMAVPMARYTTNILTIFPSMTR